MRRLLGPFRADYDQFAILGKVERLVGLDRKGKPPI